MKTIKLITCNDAVQAHIIQGALANEGIDSLLHKKICRHCCEVMSVTSPE